MPETLDAGREGVLMLVLGNLPILLDLLRLHRRPQSQQRCAERRVEVQLGLPQSILLLPRPHRADLHRRHGDSYGLELHLRPDGIRRVQAKEADWDGACGYQPDLGGVCGQAVFESCDDADLGHHVDVSI